MTLSSGLTASSLLQIFVTKDEEGEQAWQDAIEGARGTSNLVIVEQFLKFDLEITLLTIRQKDGPTIFCPPIGHQQSGGDYQCSWQPAELNQNQLNQAKEIAKIVTDKLGGVGLFGVEFFITDNKVIFSELSPRPHDTGLVTLISQNLNEFELHLRAILGMDLGDTSINSPTIMYNILGPATFKGEYNILHRHEDNIFLKIYGKLESKPQRKIGHINIVDNKNVGIEGLLEQVEDLKKNLIIEPK